MTISYTHAFEDLNSSLVLDVYYDEPTASAFVSLDEEVYRYDNVPFAEVEALVQADSIGRAFNGRLFEKGFKQKFGPGGYLGWYGDIDFEQRKPEAVSTTLTHDGRVFSTPATTTTGTAKNLTYAPGAVVDGEPLGVTGEVDIRVNLKPEQTPQETASAVVAALDERRVSLKPEPEQAVKASKFTVHFLSNGEKTYTTEAGSVEDAIKNLYEAAEILSVRVKVTGVFHHFE